MNRDFAVTVEIAAPLERVWAVMTDVERWHEWTDSITSIEKIDPAPLAVGSRVRIRQPKFAPAIWKVTELEPGRSFTWVSSVPGIVVTATHSIAHAGRVTQASLTLHYGGVLGGGLARVTQNITERYLALEAAGLKHRSENPATARTRD